MFQGGADVAQVAANFFSAARRLEFSSYAPPLLWSSIIVGLYVLQPPINEFLVLMGTRKLVYRSNVLRGSTVSARLIS